MPWFSEEGTRIQRSEGGLPVGGRVRIKARIAWRTAQDTMAVQGLSFNLKCFTSHCRMKACDGWI